MAFSIGADFGVVITLTAQWLVNNDGNNDGNDHGVGNGSGGGTTPNGEDDEDDGDGDDKGTTPDDETGGEDDSNDKGNGNDTTPGNEDGNGDDNGNSGDTTPDGDEDGDQDEDGETPFLPPVGGDDDSFLPDGDGGYYVVRDGNVVGELIPIDGGYAYLDVNGSPLGIWSWDDEQQEWIFDDSDVALGAADFAAKVHGAELLALGLGLGDLPKTGGDSQPLGLYFLFAALALTTLTMTRAVWAEKRAEPRRRAG
jgi:hypothetical protein